MNTQSLKLDSISIDYSIMEKAKNVYVVPGDFGWDEDALLICFKDKAQNVKEVLKELREKKSEYL
ncbi:hypothetical protein EDC21_12314 [Thermohydrogenium kirishiense]|uniref:hypothetical protein n=1 Tax=Thermoanaerobacterium thermosaccharolyticum TaxID=1517 RepID=UPI0010CE3289|nr:hypothetical protein EDC21_12314 [Thermohydrogenium kirishiense]